MFKCLNENFPNLVDRGQIAVCVSKGRVNLDGTGVALKCSLHILHLLQCISHV